jgi:seryl-tRNA synthetase
LRLQNFRMSLSMDNLLRALHQITHEAISDLNHLGNEQLEAFVERRDQIINQMKSIEQNFNDQEKKLIKEILQYDGIILSRMKQLQSEVEEGIQKNDRVRVQKMGYDPTYIPDSLFFDKRK